MLPHLDNQFHLPKHTKSGTSVTQESASRNYADQELTDGGNYLPFVVRHDTREDIVPRDRVALRGWDTPSKMELGGEGWAME